MPAIPKKKPPRKARIVPVSGLNGTHLDPATRAIHDSQRMMEVLYDLHGFFNERVFEGRETPLPKPVFTVSAEKRSTYGHFSGERWFAGNFEASEKLAAARDKGLAGRDALKGLPEHPDEINIHSELGLTRPFEAIAATVYHEMCHQAQSRWPAVYGKAGVGNYHNKKWHETCRVCGLETTGPKGFTVVTEEFRAFIADFPRPERWVARLPGTRGKAPTKMLLWECQCEPKPIKIRAAVEIDVTCNVCSEDFEKKGGEEK